MRKTALLLLFVAAAATSGCIDSFDGEATDTVEYVPDEVDAVVQADMAVMEDSTTQDLVNSMIEIEKNQTEEYDGPESYEEALSDLKEETELDPGGLHEFTAYGTIPEDPMMSSGDDSWGVVMSTEWSQQQVLDELQQNASVEEGEHNGAPFYTITPDAEFEDEFYAASLEEDVYAVGGEQAVRDAADVAAGDMDAVQGELLEELERVSDGYLRFAVSVPEDSFEGAGEAGMGYDMGAFQEINVVSGSYYTSDDQLGTSFNMRTGDDTAAQDLEDGVDGLVGVAKTTIESDELSEALDSVEISRQDSTVEVTYEVAVDDLVETLESLEEEYGADEAAVDEGDGVMVDDGRGTGGSWNESTGESWNESTGAQSWEDEDWEQPENTE